MMDQTLIQTIKDTLKQSPLRNIEESRANHFISERGILQEVEAILEKASEKSNNPIKIVVMGEVKSGKSTFVNALVGREVSKMDVVEATSAIYEMVYDDHTSYNFYYADGREKTVFEEQEAIALIHIASLKGESQEKIEKIQICMPLEILKRLHIVDTPGLNTVTSDNVRVTEEYLINADAILWVVNVHHIGQRDVSDEITKCLSFGKPIIGIINRLDELDEDQDEVMAYVKEEMNYLFSEIIPMSAKTSWEGIKEGNNKKLIKGNVMTVLSYLQEKIADRSEEYLQETAVQTIKTQLLRETEIHKSSCDKIHLAFDRMEKEIKSLNERRVNTNNISVRKTEEIFQNSRVQQSIHKMIKDNASASPELLADIIANSRIIEDHIEDAYMRLSKGITKAWVNYYDTMIESEEKLYEQEVEVESDQELVLTNFIMEGSALKHGRNNNMLSMSMATLLSTAALATMWAPPILIGAVFFGGAYLTNNLKGSQENREEYYYNTARSVMEEAKYRQGEKILGDLEAFSDKYYYKIKNIVTQYYLGQGADLTHFKKILEDTEVYTNRLTLLVKQI